ncbi:MAG: hypothetical protein ACE5GV_15540 [Candidatus Scalindua sp.]
MDDKSSFGLTPYFLSLALPHGQPPKVNAISMLWIDLASQFPFLAFVQIGQPNSQ